MLLNHNLSDFTTAKLKWHYCQSGAPLLKITRYRNLFLNFAFGSPSHLASPQKSFFETIHILFILALTCQDTLNSSTLQNELYLLQ